MIIATPLTAVFAQENQTVEARYTVTLSRWSERLPPRFYGVIVELTNTSNQSIRETFCPDNNDGFNLSVLYNGVAMEELPRVQQLRKEGSFNTCARGVVTNLKPDDSYRYWMQVSSNYDMSKPGTYQVTVTRKTVPGNPLISTTVKSNTLTIVVPEPKAAKPKKLLVP